MREQYDDIQKEGYQIVAVAPSNASFIKQFLDAFGPFPFDIVGDPARTSFKGVGVKTAPKLKLLTKALLGVVFRKVKNFIPKDKQQADFVKKSMATQDVYIQGGTLIFDEQGKLLWKHLDQSPEYHAKLRDIFSVIKKGS
ncbi:alkyl-hydroperoxide reductase/thiol specific antioxidant family protein [Aquisalibacillus elongatus]|uniref:Alkyl-hydroperoxide reductase/thiol specific antioxidant family protein n=1 Tax=Aquisalibacillus elongatus TaxID=485577 RepID=A0A3N5B669_9BACI|nr:alkyl-hydroperoxide reductase/thiol specific antioxidant family protein [Aquisalibacillus elongatus]